MKQLILKIWEVWKKVGFAIVYFLTCILLLITYVVSLIPTALIMKILKYDPMKRKWEPDQESYFIESDSLERSHMERPY